MDMGVCADTGDHIYARDGQVAGSTPKERAADLMFFFQESGVYGYL